MVDVSFISEAYDNGFNAGYKKAKNKFKKQIKFCRWRYIDGVGCHFETSCNKSFIFTHGEMNDGKFIYCPSCGKKIDIYIMY